MKEQNFANHGRIVPLFHQVALPIFAINFAYSLYRIGKTGFAADTVMYALVSAALIILALHARIFTLRVQDRVIRLEERLRYERLLPSDLRPRIGEFTMDQLIALRFASDAELPALARRVLDENLSDRKTIKKLIQYWRPDYLRA